MIYHIASMLAGFLMDLLLGDPYWLPHPIRLIGSLISSLERRDFSAAKQKKNIPHRSRNKGGECCLYLQF